MRRQFGPCHENEAGFTLVEMIVVLAIIAMSSLALVAHGAGRHRDPGNRTLAQSTALLATRASQAAAARGRPVSLNVDLQAGVISVEGQKTDDVVKFTPEGDGVQLATGRTLVTSPTEGAIVFLPDGSATGGKIRFQRQGQPAYQVSIHWLTGAVSYGEVK